MSKKDKKLDKILKQEVADMILEKKILKEEACPDGQVRVGIFGCQPVGNVKDPDAVKKPAASKKPATVKRPPVGIPKLNPEDPKVKAAKAAANAKTNTSAISPAIDPKDVKKQVPAAKGSDYEKFIRAHKKQVSRGMDWDARFIKFIGDKDYSNFASDFLFDTTCFQQHPFMTVAGLTMGSLKGGSLNRSAIWATVGDSLVSAIQPAGYIGKKVTKTVKGKGLGKTMLKGAAWTAILAATAVGVNYAATQAAQVLPKDEEQKQETIDKLRKVGANQISTALGAMKEQQFALRLADAFDEMDATVQSKFEPQDPQIQIDPDAPAKEYILSVIEYMQQTGEANLDKRMQKLSDAVSQGSIKQLDALSYDIQKAVSDASDKEEGAVASYNEFMDKLTIVAVKYLPTQKSLSTKKDYIKGVPGQIKDSALRSSGCFFLFALGAAVTSRMLRSFADKKIQRIAQLEKDFIDDFWTNMKRLMTVSSAKLPALLNETTEVKKIYFLKSLLSIQGRKPLVQVYHGSSEILDVSVVQSINQNGGYSIKTLLTKADGTEMVAMENLDIIMKFQREAFEGTATSPALISEKFQKELRGVFKIDSELESVIDASVLSKDLNKIEGTLVASWEAQTQRSSYRGLRSGDAPARLRSIAFLMSGGAELNAQSSKFKFYRNTTDSIVRLVDPNVKGSMAKRFEEYRKLITELENARKLPMMKTSVNGKAIDDTVVLLKDYHLDVKSAYGIQRKVVDGEEKISTLFQRFNNWVNSAETRKPEWWDEFYTPGTEGGFVAKGEQLKKITEILSKINRTESQLYKQSRLIESAIESDQYILKQMGQKSKKIKVTDYFKTPAGSRDRIRLEDAREYIDDMSSFIAVKGIFMRDLAIKKGIDASKNFGFMLSKAAAAFGAKVNRLTLSGPRISSIKDLGKSLDDFDMLVGRKGQAAPSRIQRYFEDLETRGVLENLFTGDRIKDGTVMKDVKGFDFFNLLVDIRSSNPGFDLGRNSRTVDSARRLSYAPTVEKDVFERLTAKDGFVAGMDLLFGLTGPVGARRPVSLKSNDVRDYIQKRIGNNQDPAFMAKVFQDAYYEKGLREQLKTALEGGSVREDKYLSKNGATIMEKKDLKKLVSEVMNENSGQGYSKYPYNSNEYSDEEPKDDYIEEWKSFSVELIRDETRSTAIQVAKILVKDLELFEDVLDLAGQNQSVGTEILAKLKQAREEA
jgi:hypothetical protein